MTYIIVSRGSQSNGVRVIDRRGELASFPTRDEARRYAARIGPDMPSKNMPLIVVKVGAPS